MAIAAGLADVEVVLPLLGGREELGALGVILGKGLCMADLWSLVDKSQLAIYFAG